MVLKLFHIKDPQSDNYQPAERHLKRHTRNYHLAGDPLELPQVPLGVPGPHFENQCYTAGVSNLFEMKCHVFIFQIVSVPCQHKM